MNQDTTDGRSTRANTRRKSRRAALLTAASKVFATRGYHQTRVSDIIEEAQVARGTFYLYFDSKSSIFVELLEQLLESLRSTIVGVDMSENAQPVDVQLRGIIQTLLQAIVENRELTKIVTREAVGLDAEVDRRLRDFYSELVAYVRDSLMVAERMGFARPLDHEVAAMCVVGTIKQFMERLVMTEHLPDINRMALAVLDFNLRGIVSPA
jgi:AcrR family transcriptional regulator